MKSGNSATYSYLDIFLQDPPCVYLGIRFPVLVSLKKSLLDKRNVRSNLLPRLYNAQRDTTTNT
jgi:hypothetical protein